MFRRRSRTEGTMLQRVAGKARFEDPKDPFWQVLNEALVFVSVRYDGHSELGYGAVESHGTPTIVISENLDHLTIDRDYRPVRLRASQLVREAPEGHAIAIRLGPDNDTVVLPVETVDWLRVTFSS